VLNTGLSKVVAVLNLVKFGFWPDDGKCIKLVS